MQLLAINERLVVYIVMATAISFAFNIILINTVSFLFYSVESGRGRGDMPSGTSRGGAERGCSNFLRHEIYNKLSSVEAGMSIEGQIMCIEQCTC